MFKCFFVFKVGKFIVEVELNVVLEVYKFILKDIWGVDVMLF